MTMASVKPAKRAPRGQRAESARLEAQARGAADRIALRRPVGALSAREPAALPGHPGPSRGLSAPLRTRLEAGFDADLSALRLHTSASANALASAAGARAFAAGRHIVFAEGAYRPHSAGGLRLIAHETAHALQQGLAQRPGGATHVQRSPDNDVPGPAVQAGEGMTVNEKPVDLWPLIEANYKVMKQISGKEYDPDDKKFAEDLAALKGALDGGALHLNTKSDASGKLATFIDTYGFQSFRGVCMAFDLLANSGEHEAAMRHLNRRLDLEQLGYNKAFGEYFAKHFNPRALAAKFLDEGKSAYVKKQWDAFGDRVESWLLNPDVELPATSTILGHHANDDVQRSTDQLKLNQAQYGVLQAMQGYENALLGAMRSREALDALKAELGLGQSNALSGSRHVAYLVRLSVVNALANSRVEGERTETGARKSTDPKRDAFAERLSARLGVKAQRIYNGAKMALGVASGLANRGAAGISASESFDMPKIDAGPEVGAFLKKLSGLMDPKAAASVLHLKPETKAGADGADDKKLTETERQTAFLARLPSVDEFKTARSDLVTAMRTAQSELSAALTRAPIKAQASDQSSLDRRNTLLMALLWVDWVAEWLGGAEIAANPDGVAQARYLFANTIGIGARAFGDTALLKRLSTVYEAKDLGLSYAVIPGEFEEKEGADFSDLDKEVRWIKVVSGEGATEPYVERLAISTRNLVRFFEYTQMAAEIAVLQAERKRLDAVAEKRLGQNPWQEAQERKKTLEQAKREGREVPADPNLDKLLADAREKVNHPRLYEAKGGYLVMNPADTGATAPKVQLRHPSMKARFGIPGAPTSHKPIFKDQFLIRQEGQTNRVYFWALPKFDEVWNELLTIASITEILADFRNAVKLPATATATDKLLALMIWVMDAKREAELTGKLDTFFFDKKAATIKSFNEELRQLTIVNRKIALDNMRDYLWAFENKPSKVVLPDEFGSILSAFSAVVRPAEDRDKQIVSLIFDAVDELERVVKATADTSHPSHSAIHYLLPPVQLAVSFVRGESVAGVLRGADLKNDEKAGSVAANLAKLAPFTPRYTDLEARYGRLKAVLRTLLEARATSQKTWTLYGNPASGLHTELSAKNIKPGDEWSSFILALWAGRDVSTPGEGRWKWDAKAQEPSPTDTAQDSEPKKPQGEPETTVLGTNAPIFYRIDKIHMAFEFVPPFDRNDPKTAKALYPGTKVNLPSGAALVTLSVANLRATKDGGLEMAPLRTVTIRSNDVQLMTLLAAVIDTHARNAQLQELGEMIKAGTEFALDVAEFIPGYGQAIMVARIAADIIRMISEGELDDLKADLIDAPIEIMEFITDDLLGKIDGSLIWKFMLVELFGSGASKTVSAALKKLVSRSLDRRKKKPAKASASKRSAKFKNLATAVSGVGLTFADNLLRAQQRAGVEVNSLAGNIAAMPRVAPHLLRIDEYVAYLDLILAIKDRIDEAKALVGNDPRGAFATELATLQKQFEPAALKDRLAGFLTEAAKIELPNEVVPTALLIEVALEFILSKVKNKKVQFVYQALRVTGQLPRIAQLVEKALIKNSAADPNHYWRTFVRDRFREPFQKGRDELVVELFAALNEIFPDHKVKPPKLPNVAIEEVPMPVPDADKTAGAPEDIFTSVPQKLTPSATPETDGFNLPGDPRHPHPGRLPDREGRPLDVALRERMEQAFGHDLSHVRLHDGPEADGYVSHTGAEALASGSHVYLRGDLSPGTPHGDHVLRHEIAHVLQQAGPRPKDAPGPTPPDRPVMGRPGRGLQLDPGRETAAEEMARASRRRLSEDGDPLPVRGRGPVSLAPFGRGDAIAVLRKLGEKAGSGSYTEELLEGFTPLKHSEAKSALAEAQKLRTDLAAALGKAKWKGSAPASLSNEMLGLVRSEAQEGLRLANAGADADRLVARAVTDLPRHRRKGEDRYKLRERAYLNILSGYIFEAVGVRVEVSLAPGDASKITEATLHAVHLGRVRAVGNPTFYQKIKAANPDGSPSDFTFKSARAYYKSYFPAHQPWVKASTKFEIPDFEKKKIAAFSKTAAKLDKDLLPPWSKYKNPKSAPLGLRVGLHGELSKKTSSFDNTERESHHVPQFLFAEFYSGTNESDAVSIWGRDGSYWTPGFVPEGGSGPESKRPSKKQKYDKFAGQGGSLDMTKLSIKTNRGADMPAVSLAAVTHKTGKLHLPLAPSPDNDPTTDNQSSKAQGFMMSSKHREFLLREVGSIKGQLVANPADGVGDLSNAASFKGLVTTAVPDDTRRKALEQATYKAMKSSYDWMVDYMWGRLEGQLNTLERNYYAEIALKKLPAGETDLPAGGTHTPEAGTDWIGDIKTALAEMNTQQFGAAFAKGPW